MLGQHMSLTLQTDSKSLFDGLVNIGTMTEKRLLMGLRMMREDYEQRELTEVIWIPSKQNLADSMTKKNSSFALIILVTSNRLNLTTKIMGRTQQYNHTNLGRYF